jgi:hypothetical protein
MNSITKNAPSRGCGRSAPLDNCATHALRLETIYICRYRGWRKASVAASRPALSRILFTASIAFARSSAIQEVKKLRKGAARLEAFFVIEFTMRRALLVPLKAAAFSVRMEE